MEMEPDRTSPDWDPFYMARRQMVVEQLEHQGIVNSRVLDAFMQVPRHAFVPLEFRGSAYHDRPLPIGNGQTISQPYIVALMTQLLHLDGAESVLEIGAGSGYQAAILGTLAREVHTVERHPALAHNAAVILAELGFHNVFVHEGDGSLGWPPDAPYDAIIVTAAAPGPPVPLLQQLAEGGRMVIPIGNKGRQELILWRRTEGRLESEPIIPVAFVPLRGDYGWSEEDWSPVDPEL